MGEFQMNSRPCQPWLVEGVSMRIEHARERGYHTPSLLPFGNLLLKLGRTVSLQSGHNGYKYQRMLNSRAKNIETTSRVNAESTDLLRLQLLAQFLDEHHSCCVRLAVCRHRVIG